MTRELNHLNFKTLERIDNLSFYALDGIPYTIQDDSIHYPHGYAPLFGLSILFENMTDREIKEFLYLYNQGEIKIKTSWYHPYIITIKNYDYIQGRVYLSGTVNEWSFTELSPSPLSFGTADSLAEDILFWYGEQFIEGSTEQDMVTCFVSVELNGR